MKTNQIMVRNDSRFIQRTKDGFFNASALVNSIEGTSKSTRHFKSSKGTSEFIKQLESEGIEKPYLSSNKGVWMHPKLFIDFAMYVSVEFKSQVIDYVLDGLIQGRHEAGDYYNQMCAEIMSKYIKVKGCKPPSLLYMTEARLLKKMLGIEGKSRNDLTEIELNKVTQMQKMNTLLISKGLGKEARVKRLELQVEMLDM